MWRFWVQNGPFAPNKKILLKTINMTFIYLLAFFSMQDFSKILRVDPELWGWSIFGSTNGRFLQTRIFEEKSLISFSSSYWPLSFCKILKILKMDPEFWSSAILEPKWVHLLKRIFFQKTDLNLVPIFYVYLNCKN